MQIQILQSLSLPSQISLYILMGFIGLFALLIFGWQIMVFKGKAVQATDGSVDDWHEQKIHYGIALADVFLACPACIAGIVMVFTVPRWGFYLLALVSFWFMWANIMGTATSLRFEKPRLTLSWLFTFPTGIFVGLGYLLWTIIHFETIFA